MSFRASTESQTVDTRPGADRPHLVKSKETATKHFGTKQDREWYCNFCRFRVTVTPDGLEAGHRYSCPKRPDSLPNREYNPLQRYRNVCPACGCDYEDHHDDCPHTGYVCHECLTDGFDTRRGMKIHHAMAHGEQFKEFLCSNCDEFFASRKPDPAYCSRECYHAGNRQQIEKTCPQCDASFTTVPSEDTDHCSHECYAASRWDERACEYCGEEFEYRATTNRQFCSQTCNNRATGESRTVEMARSTCRACGGSFEHYPSRDATYCTRECWADDQEKTVAESECKLCGDVFAHKPHLDRKYCSQDCFQEWARQSRTVERPEYECAWPDCDGTFTKLPSNEKRFCSASCASRFAGLSNGPDAPEGLEATRLPGEFQGAPADD